MHPAEAEERGAVGSVCRTHVQQQGVDMDVRDQQPYDNASQNGCKVAVGVHEGTLRELLLLLLCREARVMDTIAQHLASLSNKVAVPRR